MSANQTLKKLVNQDAAHRAAVLQRIPRALGPAAVVQRRLVRQTTLRGQVAVPALPPVLDARERRILRGRQPHVLLDRHARRALDYVLERGRPLCVEVVGGIPVRAEGRLRGRDEGC